jgi:Polysaccharide biosynthesis enzyme WcbI
VKAVAWKNVQRARQVAASAGLLGRGRELAVVFGNCQADAMRQLLDRSPAFAERYRTLAIPAVHNMTPLERRLLDRLLPKLGLVVAQPVSRDYRGLRLGTDQIAAQASRARVVRWPALYLDAHRPFHVSVHPRPREAVEAPLVDYHDLRALAAAHRGLPFELAADWIAGYEPPADYVRANASRAAEQLERREQPCDVQMHDYLAGPEKRYATGFHTVNHPTTAVLDRIARGIHAELGLEYAPDLPAGWEPLGHLRAPVEPAVARILGLDVEPVRDWQRHGAPLPWQDVLRAHLDWYAANPEARDAGVQEHRDKLAALALLA